MRSSFVVASLVFTSWLSATSSARAARPSFCSERGPDRHRAQVGEVLVMAGTAADAITVDGGAAGSGPVLVRNVAPGHHTLTIRTTTGRVWTQEFDIRGDGFRVVGLPGASLTRPGAPALSVVSLGSFDECDGHLLAVSAGAELTPDLVRASELARLRCDPALAPLLPTTASLVARNDDACRAGDGAACQRAGDQWAEEVGHRDADRAKATGFYRRGCELGHVASCGDLAESLVAGDATPAVRAEAEAIREQACGGGDVVSCERIAYALLRATPATGATPADRERERDRARRLALPYLSRACVEGAYRVCDDARTLQLHLSCGRGDAGACELLPASERATAGAGP